MVDEHGMGGHTTIEPDQYHPIAWLCYIWVDAANKARGMLYFIQRSFTCLTKEIFVPLYSALVRPHLEYAIRANCPYLKKDIKHLERIQRTATRWMKGLRGLTY